MSKKAEAVRPARKPIPAKTISVWIWPACILGALILVFWAYAPAAHAPFLFDDNTLLLNLPSRSLLEWFSTLRPILMISYWLNTTISGSDTGSYHTVNVLIHCVASGLIYLVTRRILDWANVEQRLRTPLAGFCALLFLLHPVQSEAVAYLAGRSESLSTLFFYAAFAIFLYRPQVRIGWASAAAVIILFLFALGSKEQTIALPALLLLTDYWWNPAFSFKGIAGNWKLYAPLALGAILGVVRFLPLMLHATTAGFNMADLTWYQYLFTEFRAIFVYIREFIFPVGLNVDWEFSFSRSIFEYGAIVGLVALLALIVLAWRYRRQFPLASYGFYAFLILMAPTSSILPIRDPIAERRLYFAIFGLLLIVADLLRRVKISRSVLSAACAAVLLLAALATHARAEVWSSELTLWTDTEAKSPDKPRSHFQLAHAYYNSGNCAQAASEFEKTSHFKPEGYTPYNLLVDWGLSLDCASQPGAAISKLSQAATLEPTAHVYTQLAKVYGDQANWAMFDDALKRAQAIDPNFPTIYAYRGIGDLKLNRPAEAMAEFNHALQLDPTLEPAKQGLMAARQQLMRQQQAPRAIPAGR